MVLDRFLDELKSLGFSGVQNFPTVGLIDGVFRANLEETGMGYGLEVDMIRAAHEADLLTTPYVFSEADAVAMAHAGADIIVCHMGLTTSGSIGAQTAKSLEECVPLIDAWAMAAKWVREDVIVLCHGGPIASPDDATYVPEERKACARLLRREQHGAPAHRARHDRADEGLQVDQLLMRCSSAVEDSGKLATWVDVRALCSAMRVCRQAKPPRCALTNQCSGRRLSSSLDPPSAIGWIWSISQPNAESSISIVCIANYVPCIVSSPYSWIISNEQMAFVPNRSFEDLLFKKSSKKAPRFVLSD